METNAAQDDTEAKIFLSVSDICRIIKQCKNIGLSELSVYGLVLKFHSHRNESAETQSQGADLSPQVTADVSTETTQEAQGLDQDALEEAAEAQMMIDNPREYESMQIRREIERERVSQ